MKNLPWRGRLGRVWRRPDVPLSARVPRALFTCLWLVKCHTEPPSAGECHVRFGPPLGLFIFLQKGKEGESREEGAMWHSGAPPPIRTIAISALKSLSEVFVSHYMFCWRSAFPKIHPSLNQLCRWCSATAANSVKPSQRAVTPYGRDKLWIMIFIFFQMRREKR